MAIWIIVFVLGVIGSIGCALAAAYPAADDRIGHGGAALVGIALSIVAATNI